MTDKISIQSIAGYCHEKALWKLLVDLTSDTPDDKFREWKVITPDIVLMDGETFCIDDDIQEKQTTEFFPPEGISNYGESGYAWSLGALVCYVSSGHYIFGGRGGIYQRSHPKAELPTLRKEHSALDPLIKRCLCFSPSQRISLLELHALATKGLESTVRKARHKIIIQSIEGNTSQYVSDDSWPEKM